MKAETRMVVWARGIACLSVLGLVMGATVAEPIVVTPPLGQMAVAGARVTFTVEATGTAPLGYQWQTSPTGTAYTDIVGATNAMLEILARLPTYQYFRVAVSDAEGAVFSSAARLTVVTLPVITRQPPSLTVAAGETITLRVEASSNVGPSRYQWRHEEVDLPGQFRTTLTLTNIQPANTGAYSVVVTNLAGAVCSEPALIQLGPAIFTRITVGPGAGAGGDRPGAWADYDNDGCTDLFVPNTQGPGLLYRNQGDGTFSLASSAGLGRAAGATTAVWGDYDNDGHLDLCLTWAQSVGLYRNVGDGTFQRASVTALDRAPGASRGCAWADFDCDGDLDLFRAIADRQPDMLFANNGDGTFTRITQGPVVSDRGYSYGASWLDFDGDGAPDLFVTDFDGSSLFYRNQGDGSFALADFKETGLLVGTVSPGLAWGDYDNDGDFDCFVPNHGGVETVGFRNLLFQNNGDGSFIRVTEVGLAQDAGQSSAARWGDYDSDGWLDLFVANGGWYAADLEEDNVLYRNNGDGTFSEVSSSRVSHDLGRSRGCSWADYDNDGFLDLFVANQQSEPDFLYHNGGNGNAWLILKLQGTASNRSAIGVKIGMRAIIGGEELWQTRVVCGHDSFTGQDDLRAHFGLGDAAQADLIRIEWPSGIVQELTKVEARQILEVTESIPDAITITLQPRATTVSEGRRAKLFAKVSGPLPLSYQWQKDGVALPTAISRILTLTNAQSSDAGLYRLSISATGLGLIRTAEVPLVVVPPDVLVSHRFTGISPKGDGTVLVHLEGSKPPGFYDIFATDATEDFRTWSAEAYLVSPDGTASFEVPSGAGGDRKFFRALGEAYWTPYLAPTGPHRVGMERRQLNDPTRERNRGPIVITIWYPAAPGPIGPPTAWLEAALVPRLVADLNPAFAILSRVHSHAVTRVPAADGLDAWPVILYSHGHWGLRSENTDLLIELVSHGYLAVAVDHVDAGLSALADGSLAEFRGGFDGATLQQRVLDLRFLMDHLEQWNADDPLLAGRLDAARIGTMGFSFGGEAALEVARIDARCRATVGLDTGFHGSINTTVAGFAKPALHLLGGLWNSLADPLRSFYDQTPGPAYLAQVQGTVHHSFGYFGKAGWPELAMGALDDRRMNQLLRAYTLSFFNKHLKGEDDHRLDGPCPEYPEVKPFLAK